MSSKIYEVSDSDFKSIVNSANNYSDCLRALGLSPRGGSSTAILKRRIEELGCSVEHFNYKNNPNSQKYSMDEILIENSTYSNRERLKIRLVQEGYLEERCDECGITEWNGKPITLQLEHSNGKNNDNRIENLRFLCPNCHSQTSTYAGRNKINPRV